MNYARVNTNLLDLWMEPRYNSERASQLLYNEPLKVHEEKNGFFRVEQSDGYSGWADKKFIIECNKSEFQLAGKSCNYIIKSAQAGLFDLKLKSVKPHFLYYGTEIKGSKRKNGIGFNTPTGEKALLKPQSLKPIIKSENITGRKLVTEAKKWLGVPFLWGGTSPAGFDCSGFARQVFGQFGKYLPRDTKDQISAGREVERNSIMIGDLIFFKRHVGIAIDRNTMIHCSVGSNGVRIESIEKGNEDYRADLDRDFATVRRII